MTRLRELDGLRIIAASMVVLAHVCQVPGVPSAKDPAGAVGDIAVLIFFVLSGFVITRMLLREIERTGTIAMGAFYLRRALRIWPASYAYIAVTVACVALRLATVQASQVALASLHMWNYGFTLIHEDQASQGHVLFGHFWSLALEEQFYWTWPLILLTLRRRVTGVLIAAIVLAPVIRAASYYLFPVSRGQLGAMFHTAYDPIAIGALLALHEERLKSWAARLSPSLFYTNAVFLFVCCPVLIALLGTAWSLSWGRTAEAASAALLILALAHGPDTALARLLRTPPFQFGGRISYSLYVWQQLFTLPRAIFPQTGVLAVVLAFAAATASYYLIERPFLALKEAARA